MNLKQIFCRHNFIDKCKIDRYRHEIKAANIETSWQELCLSRVKNKSCKKHDEKYNLVESYCDYYYQQCNKCGKVKINKAKDGNE